MNDIKNDGASPKIGEDSATINIRNDNNLLLSSDPITFDSENIGEYILDICANDIYAAGGEPKWFLITILIPPKTSYNKLKRVISKVNSRAQSLKVDIIGGHTEVTESVNKIVLSGTIVGRINKNFVPNQIVKGNQSIILGGQAGIEGSKIIVENTESNHKIITNLKKSIKNLTISVNNIAKIAISTGKIIKMHDPTEGGISTALHELCEFSDIGCEIIENEIKFVDNFNEACQILNLNPLGVISSGCLLMICKEKDSSEIINKLRSSDIPAIKIGKTTNSKKRNIIKKDGKKENLERFDQDEIIKIFRNVYRQSI
ncbi:MAG: AIR synthase-related protein [Dehalococcoidia bacterium]|nr:AIR synthase-related protein [Dehalococcoidia bacterium]